MTCRHSFTSMPETRSQNRAGGVSAVKLDVHGQGGQISRRAVEKSYDGVRESARCGAPLQQSLSAGNQRGGGIGRIMRFGSGECQGTCVNVVLGQCLRNPPLDLDVRTRRRSTKSASRAGSFLSPHPSPASETAGETMATVRPDGRGEGGAAIRTDS